MSSKADTYRHLVKHLQISKLYPYINSVVLCMPVYNVHQRLCKGYFCREENTHSAKALDEDRSTKV